MGRVRAFGAFCVRWRYPLLALWSLPWLIPGQDRAYPRGDWIFVEMGARILVHHHAPAGGSGLHLYADNSVVQIGPPALLVAAPLQWLPPHLEAHLAAAVLALLVVPALWCAERAAAALPVTTWTRGRLLLAGLVVVPVWTVEAQEWGHLDDVIALLAALGAALLVSRGRHEVLAGVILGTGVAAKPWAVVLLPLLLAYRRPQVARALLSFSVVAVGWWAPFVIAAPDTVHALGTFSLPMGNHPTWHLVGVTGRVPVWIRPLQLGGGMALSAVLVRKVGWAAVPVVALAWRVTADPYDWPYYVMGPLLGAALWDVARPAHRRLAALPWATLAVCVAGFWIPREVPSAGGATRLALFVALAAAALLVGRSTRQTAPDPTSDASDRQSLRDAAPTAAAALP